MMSEPDLFELQDPSRRLTDPRNQNIRMEKEAETQARRISSVEEMIALFKEEVAKQAPPEAEMARMKAEDCRYRIEEGEFAVENFVTRVTPGGFRATVRRSLDKTNEGTHLHTLHRTQGNGVWVPTQWGIRVATVPKNDRKRALPKDRFGGEMEEMDVNGSTSGVMIPVPVEVLQYRIVWTDAANAEDIRYDARGNVVTDQNVRVQTGSDPALAAALDRLAQGQERLADTFAPTPPPKPGK